MRQWVKLPLWPAFSIALEPILLRVHFPAFPAPWRHMLFRLITACLITLFCASSALSLEVNSRRFFINGPLSLDAARAATNAFLEFDRVSNEPIYLMLSGSGGNAQSVMLMADLIQGIKSPVVVVVTNPIQGATAALSVMGDQLVMMPSAQLIFTEAEYEGVPDLGDNPAEQLKRAPTARETLLQKVRGDFIKSMWQRVGKRIGMSADALQKEFDSKGGLVLTAQDALKRKVAQEVASELRQGFDQPSLKTEVTVTTTNQQVRTSSEVPTF